MPNIEVELSDPSFRLTDALLIYRASGRYHGDGEEKVIVTRHGVTNGVIEPGSAINIPAFMQLIGANSEAEIDRGLSWRFPRLLAESPEWVAWWSPAGMKKVFIGASGKPRVISAWIPNLVWCANRSTPKCYLFAYDGEDAPKRATEVYRPQFGPADPSLNHVHADCAICRGSVYVKSSTPAAWEDAFWSARFKEPGNLKHNTPYACKEILKPVGALDHALRSRIETSGR